MSPIQHPAPFRPATHWRLRTRTLELPRVPSVMGIVNVTPDSFSDGGRFYAVDAAVDHALRQVAEGADILDIGGESTRPYSEVVPADEERRRVLPVIERLAGQISVPLSIDTSKALIAKDAIAAGAEIINDITGLEGDPAMMVVARITGAGVCVMHMQGTPQTMQDAPQYNDVTADIFHYLQRRRDELVAAGIAPDRICLDPGIGFGKTHQHNLTLTARCGKFLELNCPVLIGSSRKGFIGKVIGDKSADRTYGTIGAALAAATQGVQIVRVHDVLAMRQALAVFVACGGIDGQEAVLE